LRATGAAAKNASIVVFPGHRAVDVEAGTGGLPAKQAAEGAERRRLARLGEVVDEPVETRGERALGGVRRQGAAGDERVVVGQHRSGTGGDGPGIGGHGDGGVV
jgi:hypothetical protein